MKQLILSLAALLAISLSACSQTKKEANSMEKNEKKTALVAYFSATGITAEAAEALAKVADADLFEIVPEKEYTADDLNWNNPASRSSVEMKDSSSRPAIKTPVGDLSPYQTIYLGFPIWWYTAPTIINTFIESCDLKGKKIIVFATSGGSTTSRATKDLQTTYPDLKFVNGGLLNERSEQEAQQLVEKTR